MDRGYAACSQAFISHAAQQTAHICFTQQQEPGRLGLSELRVTPLWFFNRPVYEFNSIIVREPSRSVVNGLRALDTGNPTYEGVKAEHDAYIAVPCVAGVEVTILPALEDFPDPIFVSDPALVFTVEGAIPVPSRRLRALVKQLSSNRRCAVGMFDTVVELLNQGFADGGDRSDDTEECHDRPFRLYLDSGAAALIASLDKIGRAGEVVSTPEGVLHSQTDCSLVDEEPSLMSRLAKSGVFSGLRQLIVPEGEEAANALRVNDVVMVGLIYAPSRVAGEERL